MRKNYPLYLFKAKKFLDMKDENENLRAELDRLKKMELNKHILILDRPVP